MDHIVVSLEEKIGKTVGQLKTADAFSQGVAVKRSLSRLCRSLGYPRYPKGAFRFTSFEEADAWMMKHQIRTAPKAS